MKRSRSLRLDPEDQDLFDAAARAEHEDNTSAWMRRVLRAAAEATLERSPKKKAK